MSRELRTVSDLLKVKGGQVWSVTPATTVFDALRLMADRSIGAVVVMDGDRLAGVMSERDYARKVILKDRSSKETAVREIMTERVFTVSPQTPVQECMNLMSEKRVRHLPVLDQGTLAGLISIGDVVKAIIAEQQYVIERQRAMWDVAQP